MWLHVTVKDIKQTQNEYSVVVQEISLKNKEIPLSFLTEGCNEQELNDFPCE